MEANKGGEIWKHPNLVIGTLPNMLSTTSITISPRVHALALPDWRRFGGDAKGKLTNLGGGS
jgi:hypothetical protein